MHSRLGGAPWGTDQTSMTTPRSGSGLRTIAVAADPSPYNRRFVRAAFERLGLHEIIEVSTSAELVDLLARVRPDVVVVDPAITEGSDIDLVAVLTTIRDATVVLSSRERVVAGARQRGFIAVRKTSTFMGEIEAAIGEALQRSLDAADAEWSVPADEVCDEVLASTIDRWAKEVGHAAS
jgi:chemotaxis response regulator CheB